MSGWFAIKHGIRKHDIFRGRPDRLGAWVAMLDEAAFADTEQDVAGVVVKVARGELCASQAMLEEITGLSRQQLRTFLAALERSGAIKTRSATKSTKGRTIVTFCNYDKYQSPQPSANQTSTKHQPTKEQDNNIPVGAAEKSAASDPVKLMFDSGRELLSGAGKSNAAAGKLLGKWRKEYGTADVIAAIGNARREGAIDPVSFIEGTLRFRQKRGATAPRADSRTEHAGAFGILREAGV